MRGNPSVRFYETALGQDVHNDLSDWIALMCLRQAKSEGTWTVVSAAAIHDIIMAERPDLLRVLYEPFTIDWRNEPGWPEEESEFYHRLPVFTYFKGRLTARLLPVLVQTDVRRGLLGPSLSSLVVAGSLVTAMAATGAAGNGGSPRGPGARQPVSRHEWPRRRRSVSRAARPRAKCRSQRSTGGIVAIRDGGAPESPVGDRLDALRIVVRGAVDEGAYRPGGHGLRQVRFKRNLRARRPGAERRRGEDLRASNGGSAPGPCSRRS